MEDLISVIVCTYNQEKTIARTLDSILMQQCHLPLEIVIAAQGGWSETMQEPVSGSGPFRHTKGGASMSARTKKRHCARYLETLRTHTQTTMPN